MVLFFDIEEKLLNKTKTTGEIANQGVHRSMNTLVASASLDQAYT